MTRLEPYESKGAHQIVLEVVNLGLRPHIPLSCALRFHVTVWWCGIVCLCLTVCNVCMMYFTRDKHYTDDVYTFVCICSTPMCPCPCPRACEPAHRHGLPVGPIDAGLLER
jgi:hypothetical protein